MLFRSRSSRSRELLTPERRAASAEDHLRILDAVASRDPERARQAMDHHLRQAQMAAAPENPNP